MKEYPYWWDTVPGTALRTENLELRPKHPEPETKNPERGTWNLEPRRFDVAVIGAGYTGLAAALHLARAGATVVVLEREWTGWGASSRNGGQVLTELTLEPAALIARLGQRRARERFDISLAAITALEQLIAEESLSCEYERTGHIQAAWKPSHFDAFRAEQALLARTFNHRVELVSRADQRTELGTDAYHGLLVDERSGALNPARYVAGLAAAARRAGACIVEGAHVERLVRPSTRWTLETARGEVSAADVLVATNGYTTGTTPELQRRLVPIGSYIVATEPLSVSDARALLPRKRMAFDSKHFLYYFRVTGDNRLLFGGRAEFARPTSETTRGAAAILRRGFTAIFPQLASARVEYAWGGNVAFTRDRMPHAGRLEDAYCAGGYCGHGIAMATYLGGLVARRMAGETASHPLLDDPFPAVPLYRGNPWFLPLVGAYYKVRDWLQ